MSVNPTSMVELICDCPLVQLDLYSHENVPLFTLTLWLRAVVMLL